MFDWIGDFFKALFDLIPKLVYLFYASLSCLIDVLQFLFRKLAGLDVYYLNGKAVAGDLVTNFIAGILGIDFTAGAFGTDTPYSALSTVFWAFILFGIIVTCIATFVALIKSHYSYDDKSAKGPMQYVYAAGKAVVRIVSVPVIVVLGLYLSQAVLQALDSITSVNNSVLIQDFGQDALDTYLQEPTMTSRGQAETSNVKGERTYIYYDIFGFSCQISYGVQNQNDWPNNDSLKKESALVASTNQTFSGSMFKVAAYNANRARTYKWKSNKVNFTGSEYDTFGIINNNGWQGFKLFQNAETDEELANLIDTAFACNLHPKGLVLLNYSGSNAVANAGNVVGGLLPWVSESYFTNFLTSFAGSFSKFNVGAVWYYYDLWNFNFIVGFGSIIICLTIFLNIIMGLMTRLFMCIGLFLIAPPIFGLGPIDASGKWSKGWTENFLKQVLMAYGAVVGMNIVFLVLPYINQIDFFRIPIADAFVQTLIIIVGLITIKALIATLSGLIGAADANETGGKISEEVGSTVGKATTMTLGAAKIAGKMGLGATKLVAKGINKATGGKLTNNRLTRFAKSKIRGKAGINLDNAQATFDSAQEATAKAESNLAEAQEELALAQTPAEIAAARSKVSAAKTALKTAKTNENTAKVGLKTAQTAYDNSKYTKFKNGTMKFASGVSKGVGQTFNAVFDTANKVLGGDKFLSGFKENTFWKKTDWQRRNAEATESLRDYLQGAKGRNGKRSGGAFAQMQDTVGGIHNDMNRGFSRVNSGMSNVRDAVDEGTEATREVRGEIYSGITDLNTNMSSEFDKTRTDMHNDLTDVKNRQSATTGAVTRARHAVEAINNDTTAIKADTAKMSADLDQVKTKLAKAERDRADALAKQEQIRKEAEEIRKKTDSIDRKIP